MRCQHQRVGKGCAVYHKVGPVIAGAMPIECRLWNCAWLVDKNAGDLSRPDRSRYVVDIVGDVVFGKETVDSPDMITIRAVQVWCDPKDRGAHRDPALRAYLERRAAANAEVAIIRYSSSDGFTLVPPSMSANGEWREIESGVELSEDLGKIFRLDRCKPASSSAALLTVPGSRLSVAADHSVGGATHDDVAT